MKIKRFIVAVVSLQLLDAGRCCPQRVTDYRTIVRGRHGGSLDTGEQPGAWTQPGHMIDGGYKLQNNDASLPQEIFRYDSPSSICMERGT